MDDERERSFWGWGWADRFPDDATRRDLRDRLRRILGWDDLERRDPPRMEDVRIPDPALGVPDALEDVVTDGTRQRVTHTYGSSTPDLLRGFRGDFAPAPDLVAHPRHEDDVRRVLAWARDADVAVVPFGGGTNVVGGVTADAPDTAGVLALDVRGLDRVLAVDAGDRTARVQAGATGPRINEQLADRGFQLRHYPQSWEFSTLGGWVATRAGGHYATERTRIDDLVVSTRMVTPAGDVLETPDVPASGAGPDPDALVLGSEGVLGVITEATVRVQRRPRHRARATCAFGTFDAGTRAVRDLVQAGLAPADARLLDPVEALVHEVLEDGRAVLVLGFESPAHPVDADLDRALEHVREHGGEVLERTGGPDDPPGDGAGAGGEGARWRSAFLEAPYLRDALVSMGVVTDTFETCLPWSRFPALHGDLHDAVEAVADPWGGGLLSCRFTHAYPDGPAPYYTFLVPGGDDPVDRWRTVKHAVTDVLADHGATVTHHHAVGRMHRPWYEDEVPPAFLRALASAKASLDPDGIMNPGALLPPSEDP